MKNPSAVNHSLGNPLSKKTNGKMKDVFGKKK